IGIALLQSGIPGLNVAGAVFLAIGVIGDVIGQLLTATNNYGSKALQAAQTEYDAQKRVNELYEYRLGLLDRLAGLQERNTESYKSAGKEAQNLVEDLMESYGQSTTAFDNFKKFVEEAKAGAGANMGKLIQLAAALREEQESNAENAARAQELYNRSDKGLIDTARDLMEKITHKQGLIDTGVLTGEDKKAAEADILKWQQELDLVNSILADREKQKEVEADLREGHKKQLDLL